MSQELIYTSAPRGLKPGSRGFCTVLSTQGMPAPLATTLEGLSGYRPLFPPADPRAADNPVVWSHLKVTAIGRTMHLLSRIADSGLDYSNRANKLAHHLILDPAELLPAGPASLLLTPGLLRTAWTDEPRVVPPRTIRQSADPPAGVCTAWKAATGDAGWAGVLAESFLADPERVAILLFAPGQDVLPLFAESISLLPADQRWNVTFSTYFTVLAPGAKCVWRAMIHDSKEAHESLRLVNALRIDLSQGRLGPAAGGKLVEAARTGVRANQSPPRRAAAASQVQDEVVFAEAETETETEEAPALMEGVPDLPIRMAKTAPFARRTPAIRRRTEESTQDEANSSFSSRRTLILVPWFLLLISIAVGVSWKFGVFSKTAPRPEVALAGNDHEAGPEVAVVPVTKPVTTETPPGIGKGATMDNALQGISDASSPAGTLESGDDTENGAAQLKKDQPQPGAEKKEPAKVFAEDKPALPEKKYAYVALPTDGNPASLHSFKETPESPKPKLQLFKPSWIPFQDKPPSASAKSKHKAKQAIVSTGTVDDEFAFFTMVKQNESMTYQLKSQDDEKVRWLAWYVIQCEEPAPSKHTKLIRFIDLPMNNESLARNVGGQGIEWILPENAIFDKKWFPRVVLGRCSISFAGKLYELPIEKDEENARWQLPLTMIENDINQRVGNEPLSSNRLQLQIRFSENDKKVLRIRLEFTGENELFDLVFEPVKSRFKSAMNELGLKASGIENAELRELIVKMQAVQVSLKSDLLPVQTGLGSIKKLAADLMKSEKEKSKQDILKELESKVVSVEKIVDQIQTLRVTQKELTDATVESLHIYYDVTSGKDSATSKKETLQADIVNLQPSITAKPSDGKGATP